MFHKKMILCTLTLALILLVLAAQAREPAVAAPYRALSSNDDPSLAEMKGDFTRFVLDTTDGMQPALDMLAGVWDDTDIVHVSEDMDFGLIGYKDNVTYYGSTANPDTFQQWLNNLTAEGGGDCPDAMFQGLLAAGRSLPPGVLIDAPVLLLAGSAPQGGRAALARTISILARNDVRVTSVNGFFVPEMGDDVIVDSWCPDAELPPSSMRMLATGTGGFPYKFVEMPADAAEEALKIALEDMTTRDVITLNYGVEQADKVEENYSFNFGQLSFFDVTLSYGCLTCTQSLEAGASFQKPVIVLRDPQGNEITAASCVNDNVTCIETEGLSYIKVTDLPPESAGTWQLKLSGSNVRYDLSVSANSDLQFNSKVEAIDGIVAGEPAKIIAILVGLTHEICQVEGTTPTTHEPEVHFALQPAAGGALIPLGVFDEADALFGRYYRGMHVFEQPGVYFLHGYGTVCGLDFQRVDPTPIRVQHFRVKGAGHTMAQQDSSIPHSFTLSNESEETQTYDVELHSSKGWAQPDNVQLQANEAWSQMGVFSSTVTLAPGESMTFDVTVHVPPDAALGEMEETSLTAVAQDGVLSSFTATAETIVIGPHAKFLPLLQSSVE